MADDGSPREENPMYPGMPHDTFLCAKKKPTASADNPPAPGSVRQWPHRWVRILDRQIVFYNYLGNDRELGNLRGDMISDITKITNIAVRRYQANSDSRIWHIITIKTSLDDVGVNMLGKASREVQVAFATKDTADFFIERVEECKLRYNTTEMVDLTPDEILLLQAENSGGMGVPNAGDLRERIFPCIKKKPTYSTDDPEGTVMGVMAWEPRLCIVRNKQILFSAINEETGQGVGEYRGDRISNIDNIAGMEYSDFTGSKCIWRILTIHTNDGTGTGLQMPYGETNQIKLAFSTLADRKELHYYIRETIKLYDPTVGIGFEDEDSPSTPEPEPHLPPPPTVRGWFGSEEMRASTAEAISSGLLGGGRTKRRTKRRTKKRRTKKRRTKKRRTN